MRIRRKGIGTPFLLLVLLSLVLAACAPQPGVSVDPGAGETPTNAVEPGVTPSPSKDADPETGPGARETHAVEIPTGLPSPTRETAATQSGDLPGAVLAAQAWLANRLGVPVEEVKPEGFEAEEWSDSCLGLAGPDEMCLQVITPGWRIIFQVNGQPYEVHTDGTGQIARMASALIFNPLSNTHWELVSMGEPGSEEPAEAGTSVSLQFDRSGEAGGSSGCNSYGGQYQVTGNTVTFREMVSTLMACEEGAVMDQEQRFHKALQTASRFEITGDSLTIWYDGEQSVLKFVRASS